MKIRLATLVCCTSVILYLCASVSALASEIDDQKPVNAKKNKQQLILSTVSAYNKHVLNDMSIEKNTKLANVVIALKLPNLILITQDEKVLNTIEDKRLMDTIRYNLSPENTNKGIRNTCIRYAIDIVVYYIGDKLMEKAVKVCQEWAQEDNPIPPPQPPNPPSYHQAPGFSPGCYQRPNGQVLCE
ncbi:MAG TPA: hypothetical protein VI298_16395 [Geobacteraceae bacterium]